MYFAHSIGSRSQDNWQRLDEHLNEVANLASRFATAFGTANAAGLAGLLHDLGKYSSAFQARLSGAPDSVDHSTAGAVEVMALVKGGRDLVAAELIAYAIAGHHAGLPDKFGGDSSLASG
jgi:CRISPR-associated endonuclease/helicase Cas3